MPGKQHSAENERERQNAVTILLIGNDGGLNLRHPGRD
jgi:hypothetical protein